MESFKTHFEKLSQLEQDGNIRLEEKFGEGLEATFHFGLQNIGTYHSWKVLWETEKGTIKSDNLKLLLYYRNRLKGYGLEN